METSGIDRTRELEIRLKAICILPEDTCIFFKRRQGCYARIKQCRYCQYSVFAHNAGFEGKGLCKFKQ